MKSTDLPLFEKHYADMTREDLNARKREDKAPRLSGLEVGTIETQLMLSQQNRFLLRYTTPEIRTQHATWLLGLSACSSNDAFTHDILDQCIARGMEFAAVVRLGFATDSIEAARFLSNRGIDWKTQETPRMEGAYSSRAFDGGTPHSALFDHAMDPKGSGRHHRPQVNIPVLHAATLPMEGEPLEFMQGVLESGQIDPSWRMRTQALGLKDGQATWISHCIGHGRLLLAIQALKHFKDIPQPALDEALLACAMVASSDSLTKGDLTALTATTKLLAARGANPDAEFSFGTAAFEELTGTRYHSQFNKPEGVLLTAREWAVRAAFSRNLPKPLERALMPSPWPAPPKGSISWAASTLSRHALHNGGKAEDAATNALMKKLFDLPKQPGLSELFQAVEPREFAPANQWSKWAVMDALLESKLAANAKGTLDYETVMSRVVKWGGYSERLKENLSESLAAIAKRTEDWWAHSRLEGALEWLNEDDQAKARSHIDGYISKATAFSKLKNASQEEREAMALHHNAFVSRIVSPEPVRIAPRRTL